MLVVANASFAYDEKRVIEDVSFTVSKGSNVAIIGESGCGKSTLLKLVYGLYDLNEGLISWNDLSILGPKFNLVPGMDFMKYLAQDFDLMPFITVAENVGKFLSNFYPEAKKNRIAELLELVEMAEYANIKAKFLSGGQMQRVAIARVLALEPEIFLWDEPFSHIDNFRKNSLRRKLFAYLKEKQITCLIATHDATDVFSFADDVLVMQHGKIIQSATAKALYANPKNHYTASLFGDVNEIPDQFLAGDSNEFRFVYPQQLQVTANSKLRVTVKQSYFRGSVYLVESVYEGGIIFFEHPTALPTGVSVCLELA